MPTSISVSSAADFQINNTSPTPGHYLRAGGGSWYVDGTIQQICRTLALQTSGAPTVNRAACIKRLVSHPGQSNPPTALVRSL